MNQDKGVFFISLINYTVGGFILEVFAQLKFFVKKRQFLDKYLCSCKSMIVSVSEEFSKSF